jgi:membrane protease YdiL (CAAX protease family)
MSELLPYLHGKSFWIKSGYLVLIIALSMVLSMAIGLIIAIPFFGIDVLTSVYEISDFNDPKNIGFLKYFQIINQVGVFIIPAIVFSYLENRKVNQYFRIDRWPSLFSLFFAVLLIFSAIPFINWMVEINEQMKLPYFMKSIEEWMRENEDKTNLLTEAFLNVSTWSGLVVNLVIIGLLAAVGEELLFRGVVLRILFDGLKNIHIAILLSALIFSALHFQFYGFLPRTVLGLIFGYLYFWTGSLWIPIVLHFVFNGATVTVAFLYRKGLIATDMESFGTTDNIYIISASILLTIGLFLIISKSNKKPYTF